MAKIRAPLPTSRPCHPNSHVVDACLQHLWHVTTSSTPVRRGSLGTGREGHAAPCPQSASHPTPCSTDEELLSCLPSFEGMDAATIIVSIVAMAKVPRIRSILGFVGREGPPQPSGWGVTRELVFSHSLVLASIDYTYDPL
jgi:hypothetical protein